VGFAVAALSVAAILAWLFWGRALQLAVVMCAAGAALAYFRYLDIAAALLGFLLLSNLSYFLPGSTSMFFAGTFVVLVLRKLLQGDVTWRLSAFFLSVVIFAAYYQITGFWVDQTQFYNWGLIIRVIPAVLVMSELMDSSERYVALFIGAAIGIIFTSVTTVQSAVEFYTSGVADQIANSVNSIESTRFYGHWPNPNIMSMTITAFLGGVIALWRSKLNTAIRYLMLVATVTGLTAILISLSRTGLIACVFIVGMMLAIERRKLALSLAVTVVVAVLLAVLPVDLFGRIAVFFDGRDSSSSERIGLLLGAWKLFWNNPILGAGMGGFENDILFILTYLPVGFFAHNTFVDVAVDGGIVGALLFVLTLTFASRGLSWRDWKVDPSDTMAMINAGLRASFVATILSLATMTAHTFVPFWVLFTLCAGFGSILNSDPALNQPAAA